MSEQEIIDILREFSDFLSIGNIFADSIRWIGWAFVTGLAMIVDGMENVTDTILLTKTFFENPEVAAFLETIRPLLWILLAISLLFTGYMVIFQRKLNGETIALNLIVTIAILVLLSDGMTKVNDFTDETISVINNEELYSSEEGTISENILSRNVTDLVEFDSNGWTTPEKVQSLPLNLVRNIKITEKLDAEKLDLENEEVSEYYLSWENGEVVTVEFDQGGLTDWNNEYYYRFAPDWLTIIVTLAVMGFTLISIAYKLARLSFELVFNQLLATIIAPIDVHDGQKTKKIIQNMLNIFVVIILIFLSMKLYIIGTAWLENNFDGFAYLIALIGFSVALIDGPNIVERLFGVDAGLKNGWGLLAGTVSAVKLTSGLAKGASNLAKGASSDSNENGSGNNDGANSGNNKDGKQSPLSKVKPKSPFGDDNSDNQLFSNSENEQNGTEAQSDNDSSSSGGIENKTSNNETQSNVGVSNAVSNGNVQGNTSAAAIPNYENPSLAGMEQTSTFATATRQAQAEQQANVIDKVNARQSVNTTGNSSMFDGSNNIGAMAQPTQQPTLNDEMQQVTNIATASRQTQADQQANIIDNVNARQSVNTTGNSSVIEGNNNIGAMVQPTQQPSLNNDTQQMTNVSTASRQTQVEQQVNMLDGVNVQHSVNTTQQELGNTSSGFVQSGQSAIPSQEVVHQNTNDVVTRQKAVQSENVQTVNEEIVMNENVQTVQGSQSVSRVSSGSNNDGGFDYASSSDVPRYDNKEQVINQNTSEVRTDRIKVNQEHSFVNNSVEERKYVLNSNDKTERLERLRRQEKVKS